MNATLIKRPSEQRTYSVNLGNQPEIRDKSQTLSGPAVTQTATNPQTGPAPLTITGVSISTDNRQVVFTLAGGTDGAIYTLKVTATLSVGSNSLEEDVFVLVSTTA